MKILVTGGTGLIGKKVCQELIRRKHELLIVSRDPEKALETLKLPVAALKWDAIHDPLPVEALRRVEAIVHLAGEPVANRFWTQTERDRIMNSRAQGSLSLATALSKVQTRPKILVSASATGFYGDRGDEELTEESKPGRGFLSEVCRAWEKSGTAASVYCERHVTLRIGFVLAREGGALQRMIPAFRSGFGVVFGSGQNWMSWIHLNDLTRLICDSVEKPAYTGIMNAVNPKPVSQAEFAREINRTVGRKWLWRIPAPLVRFVLRDMSELVLSSLKVKPLRAQETGFRFEFESLASALNDLTTPEVRAASVRSRTS